MTLSLRIIALLLLFSSLTFAQKKKQPSPPIIDMHLHAYGAERFAKPNPNPVTGKSPALKNDVEHMQSTLAAMRRYNIVKGFVSNDNSQLDVLRHWRAAAPNEIIATPYFEGTVGSPLPDINLLRSEYSTGWLGAMGEIGAQYGGLSPNDPKLEPYFALAEELDLPVGVHTGISYPGVTYDPCCPNFRVTLGNPALLEEVLARHPKLRLYIMHAGYPYLQETIAIMSVYPQVYADLAVINWTIPRGAFHDYLRGLIRAGLAKRLMFGSDQMMWPEAIGMAIDGINSARFLTREQKRDIFYNNAMQFLRWKTEGN